MTDRCSFASNLDLKGIAMKDDHERKPMTDTSPNANRQWVAPEFIVLNAGATAGGANINTEAFNYHPS
jgi:hypothetical protein